MSIDKKIDIILEIYAQNEDSEIFDNIYENLDLEYKTEGDMRMIKTRMFESGILDSSGSSGMVCFITPYGQEIYENGGWLKHINQVKLEQKKKEELKTIETRKLKDEAELARKNLRNFDNVNLRSWLAVIIASFALIWQILETIFSTITI